MNQEGVSFKGYKMAEQTVQPRQTAFKVSISSLLNGKYVQQEGWQPNYLEINEKQISRINLIATILDKQETESLLTLILDDGTANIQAKAFNEDIKRVSNLNIGDLILLIGRPRNYNNELFISIEIAKKIDPVWSKVRRLEMGSQPRQEVKTEEKEVKKESYDRENEKN